MEDQDSLLARLQAYTSQDVAPFHMPGHQRQAFPHLDSLSARLDITELPDFDNLHDAHGILSESMARLTRLFRSRRSFYLVNGSTCGLLAAIHCATVPGDTVLVARNCHRAVYHALTLCGLEPKFLLPPTDPETGLCLSLSPAAVAEGLQAHPQAKLVILTSPTYDGVVSDVASISRIAHAKGIPVLVDEAHGAHLGFLDPTIPSAVTCGADLVIQSFHKTLPSFTQTAVAHVTGEIVSPDALAQSLAIFETSSPSYLLMSALDGCTRWLEQADAFTPWRIALQAAKDSFADLQCLTRFQGTGAYAYDESKLVLSTHRTSVSGQALAQRLRQAFGIETEMHTERTVLAMTGAGTTLTAVKRLFQALQKIDRTLTPASHVPIPTLPLPQRALSAAELSRLHRMPTRRIPLSQAVGQICAAAIYAYPPGIPFIAPGERFDRETVQYLAQRQTCGVPVEAETVWVL